MRRKFKFLLHELDLFAEKYWEIDKRLRGIVEKNRIDSNSETKKIATLDAGNIDSIGILWREWLDQVQNSMSIATAGSKLGQNELQKSFGKFIAEKKHMLQKPGVLRNGTIAKKSTSKVSEHTPKSHIYDKELAETYAACLQHAKNTCAKKLNNKQRTDSHHSEPTELSENLLHRGSILAKVFTRIAR